MSSPPQESQPVQPSATTDQEERNDLVEDDTHLDGDTENEEVEDRNEQKEATAADPAPASRSPEPPSPPAPRSVQVPDRYEMGKCTIHMSITLLEGNNQPQERSVLLGVRNDADVPIISMVRLADLEPLPAPIAALLAELETSLPQRKQAMVEQLEKTQREQAAKAAKPRPATTAPAPSAQAAIPATSGQPVEKTEEVKLPAPTRPQQKQTSTSKRQAKEEDSPFEQMTFF